MQFVTQAQASTIQATQKRKIFGQIQQTIHGERSSGGSLREETISQTIYAKIEKPTVKLLEKGKGFLFTFKLINPTPTTLDKDSISGNVAIITVLKPPHVPQYISFPKMELGSDGFPLALSDSLSFSIRHFKNVFGKFDFPFSWAKFFRVLIYNSDDQLVQKYTILPEEIIQS